jgi:hypothetical protein
MPDRETDRRRQPGGSRAHASLLVPRSNPVLVLQRSIGNRAVGQVLARDVLRTGTVQIPGVGQIKVRGGNLDAWAGKEVLDTVEVTSDKGKHSRKLEQLSGAGTKSDVTVMIAPANQAGEELNVGGGTQLEIKDARVSGYAVKDGVETWRLAGFEQVHRSKITHKIGS